MPRTKLQLNTLVPSDIDNELMESEEVCCMSQPLMLQPNVQGVAVGPEPRRSVACRVVSGAGPEGASDGGLVRVHWREPKSTSTLQSKGQQLNFLPTKDTY